MSIQCILIICAFIATLLTAMGKNVPLWIAVLLLAIAQLLTCFVR